MKEEQLTQDDICLQMGRLLFSNMQLNKQVLALQEQLPKEVKDEPVKKD